MRENESRPAANRTASITTNHLVLSLGELDDLAQRARGAFVVVVEHVDEDAVRHLRRTYLSAASAERAARRASGRGQRVGVYLAELQPVYRIEVGR